MAARLENIRCDHNVPPIESVNVHTGKGADHDRGQEDECNGDSDLQCVPGELEDEPEGGDVEDEVSRLRDQLANPEKRE